MREGSKKPFTARGMGQVLPEEKWGPYVAERGWGTVREDYSENGDAWNYFPYAHAHLRAYRRAEDGIAAISDRFQVLLFAPVFWNGVDPLLKERLFGLSATEGNHGEDVKEIYYHLDGSPDQNYLKYLYKYPQRAFPYQQLLEENQRRGVEEREFELIDTGIFDDNRYFDLFIEYAKVDSEDLCIRIEAINRGPECAPLHILPHLWFRNQWSWGVKPALEPLITKGESRKGCPCLIADDAQLVSPKSLLFDYHLGRRYLYGSPGGSLLFTNNETNQEALWGTSNPTPYVKDGFHRFLIQNEKEAINPEPFGTKGALHYFFPAIEPGKSAVVELRFSQKPLDDPLGGIENIFAQRKRKTDQFYQALHPILATEEEKKIQRQALSGLIWSKQTYLFDVGSWLQGDPGCPPPEGHKTIRNVHWRHIVSMRIFAMPDKWEYPWFAAWDLTFHAIGYSLVDLDFAKYQLWLLLFDQFQHPNGAIPAYEWEFSDVNPPVQAWAVLELFTYEKKKFGREDYDFLERCFHKLLLNFSWWVNRTDPLGNNVFEGGFLGMDNIGFIDRSEKLPPGYHLDQADGAGWVALLSLNLMRMALTLAKKDPVYEGLGIKFFHHFLFIGAAVRKGYWRGYDMWDSEDCFFYSYLHTPEGEIERIKIRSLVGIIPFFALDVWDEEELKRFPEFYAAYQWIVQKKPHLAQSCMQTISHPSGNKQVLSLLHKEELVPFLEKIWDPNEFRSEYGLRSLSKYHEKQPATLNGFTLFYEPGEAKEKIKGGNSNWRGPIWFPLNYLLIDRLRLLGEAFQDTIQIQVGEGPSLSLEEMADAFSERLIRLFQRDEEGRRPIFGDAEKFQTDPHFKDYLLFFEHFHGDSGRGLGASHQTGWTALVAKLIEAKGQKKKPG